MPSTRNGEWPMYTADLRGSKYSPLDQINGTNFSKLEVAWRLKTDNFGPRPETKLEGTPIMVKGMLYATAGTRRAVVALEPDAPARSSGPTAWTRASAPRAGRRASCRAAASPTGPTARVTSASSTSPPVTAWSRSTRRPASPWPASAPTAVVDLKQGIMINGKQADLEKSEIGLHSTPTVVGDTILVGSSMFEGLGYEYATNVQGQARAFDARTGKLLWSFHGIPRRGEFGFDTWKNESAGYTGNNGVWTQITADPEAGIVYLPVETPTIDEYGGNRPGDNLFAESLVAVDLQDRRAQVALPVRASPAVGSRHVVGAAADRHHHRRQAAQGRGGALEAGLALLLRPHHRRADLADRGAAGSADDDEARADVADAAVPDQAGAVRAHLHQGERPDRLHAGAAHAGAREPQVLPLGAVAVRSADRSRVEDCSARINIGNTAGGTNWPGAGFDVETGIFYSQAGMTNVTVGHYSEEEFSKVTPENKGNRTPRWEAEPNYGLPRSGAGAPGARPRLLAAVASTSPVAKAAASSPKASKACRSSSRHTACCRRSTSRTRTSSCSRFPTAIRPTTSRTTRCSRA